MQNLHNKKIESWSINLSILDFKLIIPPNYSLPKKL